MAQHEITGMVDEEILERARLLGMDDLSTQINEALGEHVDRAARRAALDKWIEELDEKYGLPSEDAMVWAAAACDEAEGIIGDRGAA